MNRLLACALLLASAARAGEPLRVVSLDTKFYEFPLSFAESEGFFSRAGVSVRRTTVARAVTGQVLAGQADAALVSAAPVLSAFQNGADLKVVASLYPRFDYYAVSRFPPGQEKRIKVVAFNSPGAAGRLLLEPFLDRFGLDRSTLSAIVAPTDAARLALLERGQADLTNISSPELLRKIRAEKRLHLMPASEAGRSGERSVVVVSGKVLAARGEEVGRFLSALRAAIQAAAADREKAARHLVSVHGYSAEEAAAFADGLAGAAKGMDFAPSAAALAPAVERLGRDAGPRKRPLSELVDPRPAR